MIIARPPLLGLLAGICLASNYYYFMIRLKLSSPSNTAVIIQIAPLLVVISGVFIYKETFNKGKQLGLAVAILGFFLFYLDQRANSAISDRYFTANSNIVFAAIVWTVYAVAMKGLTGKYEAQNLNFLVYGLATIVLMPGTQWSELTKADGVGWFFLISLGLNTVLAYGSLLESLKYIPLSHISMITALNPFVTMTTTVILSSFSFMEPEKITILGYTGATLAISGVAWVVSK